MAQIQSGDSSDVMVVDPTSKAARVTLYDHLGNTLDQHENDSPAVVNGIVSMGLNDRSILPMRVDRFGSQAQASHMPLFMDSFEGTVLHNIRWTSNNNGMSAAQGVTSGFVINSGGLTSAGVGYMIQSNRRFMKTQRQPLHGKFRVNMVSNNNSMFEIGFGDAASAVAANSNGAYFQGTASGIIQPVVTFNGVDTTGTDIRALIDPTKFYVFDIFMDDDEAVFIVQDTSTGIILSKQSIKVPLSGLRMFATTQLPVLARVYNAGVAPVLASRMAISDVYVSMLDGVTNAPQPHIFALSHRDATASIFTGAQTALYANSAAPASATLSNTVAGYSNLGGLFQFAAVAGAATDYALFGFQVPSPATLVITGIAIEAYNTGAAVATTPTTLVWGLVTNQIAVSLATTNAARVGLGVQTLAVGTPIGGNSDRRISKDFQTPIVCGPGRWIDIILRMPVGTATASQIIAGMVSIEGYFI